MAGWVNLQTSHAFSDRGRKMAANDVVDSRGATAATCRYNGRMRWQRTRPSFTVLVLLAVACASQGGGVAKSEKTAAAKKPAGCDNFAHPCSAEEACIDGTCRPKGCS